MARRKVYRVPSMTDIATLEPNGFNVVSTFSGGGGSSLGYKMAGFKVLWANEFIDAARDTYSANFPGTHVDARDIRDVTPADILDTIGMRPGELDVFDGSPPCSAFSLAGSRDSGWGKVKSYSDKSQRVDDLFFEYARLVEGVRPKVFVAENVPGLVVGAAKGYFKMIMTRLRGCGYVVKAAVLDARWLGVPQARKRLIFIGVRNDLDVAPAFPTPDTHNFTIRDALPQLGGRLRFDSGFQGGSELPYNSPMPTVMAGGVGGSGSTQLLVNDGSPNHDGYGVKLGGKNGTRPIDTPAPTVMSHNRMHTHNEISIVEQGHKRKLTIPEVRRICSFPDDFVLTGPYPKQWERLGRAVPPIMMSKIAGTIRDEVLPKCAG